MCLKLFCLWHFITTREYPKNGQSDLQPYHPCGFQGSKPLRPPNCTFTSPTDYICGRKLQCMYPFCIVNFFFSFFSFSVFSSFFRSSRFLFFRILSFRSSGPARAHNVSWENNNKDTSFKCKMQPNDV